MPTPQRALDQRTVVGEARKNKKNKKGGKVKIVAGIMTREQESDSTPSPEKEGGVEAPSPQRSEGQRGYQRPLHGGYVSQPVTPPEEMMCSFCGGNTHDYRDCPTMHQYIRAS